MTIYANIVTYYVLNVFMNNLKKSVTWYWSCGVQDLMCAFTSCTGITDKNRRQLGPIILVLLESVMKTLFLLATFLLDFT